VPVLSPLQVISPPLACFEIHILSTAYFVLADERLSPLVKINRSVSTYTLIKKKNKI